MSIPAESDLKGTIVCMQRCGHREWVLSGRPTIEYTDGTREWHLNGKLHREDGPAIEFANGTREWYLHGKLHRENGPAIELADGTRWWYWRERAIPLFLK